VSFTDDKASISFSLDNTLEYMPWWTASCGQDDISQGAQLQLLSAFGEFATEVLPGQMSILRPRRAPKDNWVSPPNTKLSGISPF
jgi:hypothetical protein